MNIELDVFYPSIQLAFEFQGEPHYRPSSQKADDLKKQQARDLEKQHLCQSRGITLLTIPYWWDGSINSLSNTIHKSRPDLVLPSPTNGKFVDVI